MSRGRKKYISPPISVSSRVKHPEYRTLDVYAGGYAVEDLKEMRRVLAKQANQRIVRLEKAKSEITGEAFNQFGAVSDVYSYLENKGRKRFSESANYSKNAAQLRHEITVLQGFLGRKSSTVKGMREIESARLRTWKKNGIQFANTKEFYDFLNSETFRSLVSSGFTSEQIVEAYDQAREKQSDSDVLKKMEQALEEFRSKESKVNLKNLESMLDIRLIR